MGEEENGAGATDNLGRRERWTVVMVGLFICIAQRLWLVASAATADLRRHLPVTLRTLFLTGYRHWDATWYIRLAAVGYTRLKDTAFWPVYPLCMRLLHALTGRSFVFCGVAVSSIAFACAVCLFGLLVMRTFGLRAAIGSMGLYAFFPTAYYFEAVYTEALFMALLIGAVYAGRTGRFALANLLAALATLTRNTGILVCVILLLEHVRQCGAGIQFWTIRWWRGVSPRVAWILLAPAAFTLYCLWLHARFGHYLAFLQAERIFNRHFAPPWRTVAGTADLLLHPDHAVMSASYVQFEAMTWGFAVLTLLIGLACVGKSLTLWGWWLYALAVTFVISADPALNLPDYLLSVPRFDLMLFPAFAFLARWLRKPWMVWLVVVLFAAGLFWKNGDFVQGVWIA
ncbi:MAG: hypothetical protein K6T78_16260 [Alicyclobacillus sp.]|nr:hypothetical protein [Alicyclobacillus sp.]